MPLGNFACPNFTLVNLFCPTQAAVSPATAEVARVIYYNGRANGMEGLEAVAHVIQNRMAHPSFPQDAASVVRLAGEDFAVPQGATTMVHSSAMDRQLIEHARRLAALLVDAPQRLASQDPTAGALHIRTPSEARGRGGTGGSTNAHAEVAEPAGRTSSDGQWSSGPTRPQSTLPCLRENRGSAEASEHRSAGGAFASAVTAPTAARAPENGGGSSASASSPTPATGSGQPPAVGQSNPASSQANVVRGPAPSSISLGESLETPRARQPGLPLRPPMPGRSARMGFPAGAMGRPGVGREVEVDVEGYHDMMLPCGLFQDEVIDIMYRDLTPEDFERLLKLDERLPKRNTVKRTVVERLHRCLARDTQSAECRVCLGEFDPASMVVQLPCKHAFHIACISKWLTQCKDTCPLCSAPIEAAPKGGASDGSACAGHVASSSTPAATPQVAPMRPGENI